MALIAWNTVEGNTSGLLLCKGFLRLAFPVFRQARPLMKNLLIYWLSLPVH